MIKYVVALYIRLSVDDKISESLSIENQKKLLNTYVDTSEEFIDAEILEFVDNGYSGTNFERPAVQEILELVENRKINCIIVKDFSRFGRNSLEVGYFTEKVFPIFNIRFISLADNFDTKNYKNDTGGMGVAFQYLINEHYSRDLSKKVKSAVYAKMYKGEFITSFCPYGYKKSEYGKLVIDDEAAKVVVIIFKLFFEVDKITDIPKKLNELAIITPSQYKRDKGYKLYSNAKEIQLWTLQSVKKILRNEFYTGTFIGKRYETKTVGGSSLPNEHKNNFIRLEDNHPKIIDTEIFNKVQSLIVVGNKKPYMKNDYSLRSKVKCGVCNHAMARFNKEKIFKCRYTINMEEYSCKGLKILESELEEIILIIIKKQAEIILGKNSKDTKNSNEILLKDNYYFKINTLEKEKMGFYEDYINKKLTLEEFRVKNDYLSREIFDIKNVIKSIEDKKIKDANITNLKKFSEEILELSELNSEIVNILIDKINVYPNKKVEIIWKLKGFTEVY